MATFKRIFWDIETCPNIGFHWSFGKQYLSMDNVIHEGQIMCICWKEQGKKKVHHLQWNGETDKSVVAEFKKIIDEADELVAQFGDNFDLPWYNGRHLIHGLPPVAFAKTADTYKMASRHFRLNCFKLDYLASLLFNERKVKTTFEWWRRCHPVTNPDEADRAKWLAKMVRYCKKDVVLLEKVWGKLAMYDPPGTHQGVYQRSDQSYKWTCPRCASDRVSKSKTRVTAKGTIQHQMKCKDCGGYYVISNADFRRYQEDTFRR